MSHYYYIFESLDIYSDILGLIEVSNDISNYLPTTWYITKYSRYYLEGHLGEVANTCYEANI